MRVLSFKWHSGGVREYDSFVNQVNEALAKENEYHIIDKIVRQSSDKMFTIVTMTFIFAESS